MRKKRHWLVDSYTTDGRKTDLKKKKILDGLIIHINQAKLMMKISNQKLLNTPDK